MQKCWLGIVREMGRKRNIFLLLGYNLVAFLAGSYKAGVAEKAFIMLAFMKGEM